MFDYVDCILLLFCNGFALLIPVLWHNWSGEFQESVQITRLPTVWHVEYDKITRSCVAEVQQLQTITMLFTTTVFISTLKHY